MDTTTQSATETQISQPAQPVRPRKTDAYCTATECRSGLFIQTNNKGRPPFCPTCNPKGQVSKALNPKPPKPRKARAVSAPELMQSESQASQEGQAVQVVDASEVEVGQVSQGAPMEMATEAATEFVSGDMPDSVVFAAPIESTSEPAPLDPALFDDLPNN